MIGTVSSEIVLYAVFTRLSVPVMRRLMSLNRSLYYHVQGSDRFWMELITRISVKHTDAVIRQMPGRGYRRYARSFLPRVFHREYICELTRKGEVGSRVENGSVGGVVKILCVGKSGAVLSDGGVLHISYSRMGSVDVTGVHDFVFTYSGEDLHYLDLEGRLHHWRLSPWEHEAGEFGWVERSERFVSIFTNDTDEYYSDALALITTEGAVILTDAESSYWYPLATPRPILTALYLSISDTINNILHLVDLLGEYHQYVLLGSQIVNQISVGSVSSSRVPSPIVKVVGTELGPPYLLLEDGRCYRKIPPQRGAPPELVQFSLSGLYDISVVDQTIDTKAHECLSVVFADGRAGFVVGKGKLRVVEWSRIEATMVYSPCYLQIHYLRE